MRSIEITAKTVEEAKQLAATELGVSVDDVEIEILEEPSKGFLGLSHTPARVKATTQAEPTETPEEPVVAETAGTEASEASGEAAEVAEEMTALLGQILEAMGVQSRASIKEVTDEEISIEINGEDVAILIGKQGQTLDALQYLLGIAANKKRGGRIRLVLDAEGYRQRHADSLIAKAMEYVRHVKETGEEAVFDPMSARDRRTIHLALQDDPDIYTYSEGYGEDRHLVISPRKEGEAPKEGE